MAEGSSIATPASSARLSMRSRATLHCASDWPAKRAPPSSANSRSAFISIVISRWSGSSSRENARGIRWPGRTTRSSSRGWRAAPCSSSRRREAAPARAGRPDPGPASCPSAGPTHERHHSGRARQWRSGVAVIGALFGRERRRALPGLCAEQRSDELDRLIDDARPHEDLVRAVALLGRDRPPDVLRVVRVPDLAERRLAQIADRRPLLADADVAVGVHDGRKHAGPARHELPLLLRALQLRPLQHRLDQRAVAVVLARRPESTDVLVEVAILLERGALERGILSLAADDREVVVGHLRAAVVEERREPPDLGHVLLGRGRDGVDLQPRIFALQRGQRVVGLHRLAKRIGRLAELVVKGGHAVERDLDREQLQAALLQHAAQHPHGLVREPGVGRDVDLLDPVPAYELPADRGEFLAQERLAAGQVEILDRPEILGERDDLLERQIIALVELLPVEAVLATRVADRIYEEDQERRAGHVRQREVLPGELRGTDDALREILHRFAERCGCWNVLQAVVCNDSIRGEAKSVGGLALKGFVRKRACRRSPSSSRRRSARLSSISASIRSGPRSGRWTPKPSWSSRARRTTRRGSRATSPGRGSSTRRTSARFPRCGAAAWNSRAASSLPSSKSTVRRPRTGSPRPLRRTPEERTPRWAGLSPTSTTSGSRTGRCTSWNTTARSRRGPPERPRSSTTSTSCTGARRSSLTRIFSARAIGR